MIDAYAHIVPPRYLERVERLLTTWQPSDRVKLYRLVAPRGRGAGPAWTRAGALLDRFPDYRQVLVPGFPTHELGDPRASLDFARAVNDELADLVRDHPDKFAGFAAELPLNDVDPPLRSSIARCTTSGRWAPRSRRTSTGCPLDDPRFEPLFAPALEELDRALWLHPARSAIWPDYPSSASRATDLVVLRLAL